MLAPGLVARRFTTTVTAIGGYRRNGCAAAVLTPLMLFMVVIMVMVVIVIMIVIMIVVMMLIVIVVVPVISLGISIVLFRFDGIGQGRAFARGMGFGSSVGRLGAVPAWWSILRWRILRLVAWPAVVLI